MQNPPPPLPSYGSPPPPPRQMAECLPQAVECGR
jgi:hypothetical protein